HLLLRKAFCYRQQVRLSTNFPLAARASSRRLWPLFLYLPFDGLVSLYIVSLVFGLSQGGIVPSYAIIIREYLPGVDAGTRVGFVMMCTIMGMAIGGWMSGWIYDLTGSYAAAFWNGIVWNFLNIAIVLFLITKNRKSKIMRLQTAV
ncbi:MAG: MFS transporter, partial [Paracoccaceae bacterium]|nr:MFS transporter [Paracoccaceae bacterium]